MNIVRIVILIGAAEHIIIQHIVVKRKSGGAVGSRAKMCLDAEWGNTRAKRRKKMRMRSKTLEHQTECK